MMQYRETDYKRITNDGIIDSNFSVPIDYSISYDRTNSKFLLTKEPPSYMPPESIMNLDGSHLTDITTLCGYQDNLYIIHVSKTQMLASCGSVNALYNLDNTLKKILVTAGINTYGSSIGSLSTGEIIIYSGLDVGSNPNELFTIISNNGNETPVYKQTQWASLESANTFYILQNDNIAFFNNCYSWQGNSFGNAFAAVNLQGARLPTNIESTTTYTTQLYSYTFINNLGGVPEESYDFNIIKNSVYDALGNPTTSIFLQNAFTGNEIEIPRIMYDPSMQLIDNRGYPQFYTITNEGTQEFRDFINNSGKLGPYLL